MHRNSAMTCSICSCGHIVLADQNGVKNDLLSQREDLENHQTSFLFTGQMGYK